MTRKYFTIPAVVAGALGMGAGIAWAAEPSTQELMDQIKQLQSKVADLENRQTTLSDAQVSATIDSVLRDAEKRSQLFQMEGFTAGHDGKNFWLRSSDGNYALSPRFQFQFRHTVNWQDEPEDILGDDDDDSETIKGFEIRRMKLEFVGNAISQDLTYNFRWATDSDEGSFNLENAYIMYQFNDQWAFRAGQWKDNVFHEENVSSSKQLAADRSLINELLAGGVTDYVQGASLIYNAPDSPVRGEIAMHDGLNTDNTDFTDSGGDASVFSSGPNFGFSVRGEWAMNNNFTGYDDFTAMGNQDDLLVFGVGVDWTQTGSTDAYLHTVDVQWEGTQGLGLYAAYIGQFLDAEGLATDDEDSLYNWGALVQAGYMLNENWEIFGRYNYIDLDEDAPGADEDEDTFHEITGGVNYYFKGHSAKVTIDVGYLPEGSPTNETGIGVLQGSEDQFYVRGQFQLLI
jgi:hypothetical protein